MLGRNEIMAFAAFPMLAIAAAAFRWRHAGSAVVLAQSVVGTGQRDQRSVTLTLTLRAPDFGSSRPVDDLKRWRAEMQPQEGCLLLPTQQTMESKKLQRTRAKSLR